MTSPPIMPFIREADFAVRGPWQLSERRLLDYLIVVTDAGILNLRVEDREIELRPGDIALIQPGDRHSFHAPVPTTTPYAHLDFFYDARRHERFPTRPGQTDLTEYAHLRQPRLDEALGLRVPVSFQPRQRQRFRSSLLRMIGLWRSRDGADRVEAQILATELLLHMMRDFAQPVKEPAGADRLWWVPSYLSTRLAEPVSVADLARRAHLSPSHFTAEFTRRFGVSPYQYLIGLRVAHAQSLLTTSDLSLATIAALCGFADAPHLSKAFKNVTGVTPGGYRGRGRPQVAA